MNKYSDMDTMEKDFNIRIHTLREKLLDAETLARDLLNDCLWDDEDRQDIREALLSARGELDCIMEMFE